MSNETQSRGALHPACSAIQGSSTQSSPARISRDLQRRPAMPLQLERTHESREIHAKKSVHHPQWPLRRTAAQRCNAVPKPQKLTKATKTQSPFVPFVSSTDVAEGLEFREVKFVREHLEVDAREAGHRAHELLQPGQVRVEFFKHALLTVLDLVLRLVRNASGRSFQNLKSRALSMIRMPPM